MIFLLYFGGVLLLVYAIIRLGFWCYLSWGSEFNRLTNMNIGFLVPLNKFMPFLAIVMAFLCFAFPVFLMTTIIGQFFLVLTGLSFAERALEQLIFTADGADDPSINPNISIAVLLASIIGGITFLLPVLF